MPGAVRCHAGQVQIAPAVKIPDTPKYLSILKSASARSIRRLRTDYGFSMKSGTTRKQNAAAQITR